MKKRMGFVSNSSSSSFVVLLPENFDIEKIDFSKYQDDMYEEETDKKIVKEIFQQLLIEGSLWDQENCREFYIIAKILNSYIIGQIETSPEGGSIVLANRDKVKEILNEN